MYDGSSDIAIGSNSNRLGFKGEKELAHGTKAIWKFENELDLTTESKPFSACNRYVGLEHKLGTVLVGYHDTIDERRGIPGAGNGSNKFNIRARNSTMYISPSIRGLELPAMGSTGNDTDKGDDNNGIVSYSAVYKRRIFYAGAAYEDQSILSDTEGKGIRVGAGEKIDSTKVSAMFENLSSDSKDAFTRNAYGGSIAHGLGDLTLKAHFL